MRSPSWAKVKQALAIVLVAPPEDRGRAIDSACAGDEALKREVEEYLRHDHLAQSQLPTLPCYAPLPAAEHLPPEHVGRWRILHEIGRGGMGVVYLAERDDGEYHQIAALKLVQDRRATTAFVDLFRRERQILAQLEHPNIARLLDGGSTPDGQPFYVMEYVEGVPLTEYCRQSALSIDQRIRLFLKVCDGVSHAHRRLIIHRDLKPGNIQVNAAGEPKLLDFGLAKMLEPEVDAHLTLAGMPLLTPTYASPEQVRGEHLTTASDVYSLGVTLYELISGRVPYESQGRTLFQMWNEVCDRTPPPPGVNSDLDSIVMMAIRKEPAQRYWSVEAFQADLERYLAGMPVRARQGNALYRMRRFVVRRKWAVAAAATVLLGAALAFAAIWRAERQAEARFRDLRQFAHSVVFELHDSIENLPGSTAARKLLVERSLRYLGSLEASRGDDQGLKWELAEAYKRIGDAQGNAARANLGDSAGALESSRHARVLLREIVAANAANLAARKSLAELDRTLADVQWDQGHQAESLALYREAIETLRQVASRDPSVAARRTLALAQWSLATSLTQTQDWPAAARAWEQTLALFEALPVRRNIALSRKHLASVYMLQNRYPEAIAQLRAAEQLDRESLAAEPAGSDAKMDLSFDLSDLGLALSTTGEYREAIAKYEGALALRRDVSAADPNDYRSLAAVGRSLDRLALAYQSAGDLPAAIRSAREGAAILTSVSEHDPARLQSRKEAVLAFARLGSLCAAQKDWRGAQAAYQRASALLGKMQPGTSLSKEDKARLEAIPAALEESRRNLALGR